MPRLGVSATRIALVIALGLGVPAAAIGAPDEVALVPYTVVRDTIPQSLTSQAGDPVMGKKVIENRKLGNCLSCHAMALPDSDQGNVGPDLHGVGSRLSPAQLRLRLVNMKLVDPGTIMPAFYRVDGLTDVAKKFVGKPMLTAQQIEDVVAFLSTSK